jgi:Cdc6-like AAA superfamily ATPase
VVSGKPLPTLWNAALSRFSVNQTSSSSLCPTIPPPSSLCPLMRCLRRPPPVRSNAPAARGQAGLQPSPVQGPDPRKCQRNHQAFQVNWKLIGLVFRFSGHMRDAQQLNCICCRITLLLGPPGCGKTTLLKALAGRLNKSLKVCVAATDHNSPCIIAHQCYTVPSLYAFFVQHIYY